jgi:hypothetical protein
VIKLFGAKLKCAKRKGYVCIHLVAFVISYSKFIGWEIEGRKYAAAGGDQVFLMTVP